LRQPIRVECHGAQFSRNPRRAGFLGIQVWRIRLLAFVVAGVFGGVGGMLMSLFVSSAYPDFAYWTISGEAVFMILLGGMNVFLGPLAGAGILLLLNDMVTRFTEHYSLVLGIVILFFALGLRKGLLGFVVDVWAKRAAPKQPAAFAAEPAQRS